MARCDVCFRHCEIAEGKLGFCGARSCISGKVVQANYGKITSLALDPIEKKPLARFHPGSLVLSAGSYGCNLRCPFCQNYEISWSEEAWKLADKTDAVSPEELTQTAAYYREKGNIGVAFTYNEPLVGYEYVLDTARLVKQAGMDTVLVTNGTASLSVLEKLAPYIDAMNIDLKGFTDRYYEKVLKGDRKMVMDFIARAVQICHVELTTLIVPGENDSEEEMVSLSSWVAGLTSESGKTTGYEIPLHISRFFPRFMMQDRKATEVGLIYHLAEVARKKLKYVYTGNC
ncbi:pyruvate formate lyase activating enzyme [Lachnospiraceae bacterium NK3A20]|nr:pyruvate formate lyase activating enzyme [Lachnospiraceae bacterium NK3A20]